MFQIGQKYEEIRKFSQEEVDSFSKLTGDRNNLHRSNQKDYMMFSGPIVHGALIMGEISKIFAMDLPGPGTIYLSQNLLFKAPLYIDQEAKFIVEIIFIDGRKITLSVMCEDLNGKILCSGEAILLNKSLSKEDIIIGLKEVGLKAGDLVLVHSSFNSFGPVQGGPNTVIDALLETLTEDGTLVMPTFNFDFNKGVVYNRRDTPSAMGIISEIFRTKRGVTRTYHPIYGFSIMGKLANELSTINNISSYGDDSFFGELRRRSGKILILGLSYNDSMTFFHHVEEMTGCNYRYMKNFSGDVIYEDGTTKHETYTMFVRDIDAGVKTMVDPMGERLEQLGLVNKIKIGSCDVKLLDANATFNATREVVLYEPHLLHRIEK